MDAMIYLTDAVKVHEEHPDTFEIPTDEEKAAIKVGDYVKVIFNHTNQKMAERMWLKVISEGKGELNNDPFVFDEFLTLGEEIEFKPEHVVSILTSEEVEAMREASQNG